MPKYNGVTNNAGALGARRASAMGKGPAIYPWKVENSSTAGAKWSQPKNYTKRLRSYANQGLQQYTEHPTAYTEELENDVIDQFADTTNAHAGKTNDQFKTDMARTGLAGQPVAAANSAQLGYERGKDMANKITDTRNQFAVQRQEDYEDWLNYVRQENAQDRQLKLARDQMNMQMAMFNAARQDRKKEAGSFANKIAPWANMGAGLFDWLLTKKKEGDD